MAVQPTAAICIHKLRKSGGKIRKVYLRIWPSFRSFFHFFRDAAPGTECISCVFNPFIGLLVLFKKISSCNDGQDPAHPFKLGKSTEGEAAHIGSVPFAGGGIGGLLRICSEFCYFIQHGAATSSSFWALCRWSDPVIHWA